MFIEPLTILTQQLPTVVDTAEKIDADFKVLAGIAAGVLGVVILISAFASKGAGWVKFLGAAVVAAAIIWLVADDGISSIGDFFGTVLGTYL